MTERPIDWTRRDDLRAPSSARFGSPEPFQFESGLFPKAAQVQRDWAKRTTTDVLRQFPANPLERHDAVAELNVRATGDPVANAKALQAAIQVAERRGGGVINVGDGTYRGNISIRGDNISLVNRDGKAVFDMTGKPRSDAAVLSIRGKNATIDGITIQNWQPGRTGEPVVGVAVLGGSEKVVLRNLHVRNIGSPNGGAHAVLVMSDGKPISDVSIERSTFSDLKLGQHEAVSFMAENGSITKARVTDSQFGRLNNIAIVFEGSNRGAVRDFEVRGNRIADATSRANPTYHGEISSAGIQVDTNVSGGRIWRNVIENNDHGIVLESEKGGAVRNIDISENVFRNNRVAHVFADGSHHSGIAVDGAKVHANRYTTNAPMLEKDKADRIRGVVEFDNRGL
jgi:hypothetical protein